jgi:hypothetical protein
MENILNGGAAVYIIAALSAVIAISESLGSSEKFKSNSVLQLVDKIVGGLLKLIKRP